MANEEMEQVLDNSELEAALAEEELSSSELDADAQDDAGDGTQDPKETGKSGKASSEESDESTDKEPDEALEELEAAELEIEDDPATLLIDEAAEIREMRREELGLTAGQDMQTGEFVCSVCFLMKAGTQLANKTRKICADCV
jgi:hypothetical protein